MLDFKSLCGCLTAALALCAAPARAEECSALKLLTSLDLKAVAPGRPGVAVEIAGTPGVFLLDTGGAASTLNRSVVDRLQLPAHPAPRFDIKGVNGIRMNRTVRVASLDIGAVHRDNPLLYVSSDAGNPPPDTPGHFDGSIGPDIFQLYDADFDFAHGKFNLFSQDHCPGQVVYWQAPSVVTIPFDTDVSGHVVFDVMLDGRKISAMLDTGAVSTNLNLATAERDFRVDVGDPDVERAGQITGNYTVDIYRRNFRTLSIGGLTIANPSVVLIPDMITSIRPPGRLGTLFRPRPALPPLVIGMPVLRLLHVYIAYGERRMYITAANPEAPTQQ